MNHDKIDNVTPNSVIDEKILSDIDARLSQHLSEHPADNKAALLLVYARATLRGPAAVDKEIDGIRHLTDLDESELEIRRQILVMGYNAATAASQAEKAEIYQRLLRRHLSGQPLDQAIPYEIQSIPVIANHNQNSSMGPWWERFLAHARAVLTHLPRRKGFKPSSSPTILRFGAVVLGATALFAVPIALLSVSAEKSSNFNAGENSPSAFTQTSDRTSNSTVVMLSNPSAESPSTSDELDNSITEAISNQMARLREAYDGWAGDDQTLMGKMLLKLNLDGAGNVVRVDEVISRITDNQFINVVIAEARKWRFPHASAAAADITVPLLFVPKGMDANTVAKLDENKEYPPQRPTTDADSLQSHTDGPLEVAEPEKGNEAMLAKAEATATPPKPKAEGTAEARKVSVSTINEQRSPNAGRDGSPQTREAATAKPVRIAKSVIAENTTKAKKLIAKSSQAASYKAIRSIPLRETPRFGATQVATLSRGHLVTVVDVKGSWLKVEAPSTGTTGYVRKEYVTPVKAAN